MNVKGPSSVNMLLLSFIINISILSMSFYFHTVGIGWYQPSERYSVETTTAPHKVAVETVSLQFLGSGLLRRGAGQEVPSGTQAGIPEGIPEFINQISGVLPGILHCYQGPLWLCYIWTFETPWLYSEGKCIHYIIYESESTENALSSPLREIDFIMLAEWALSGET